MKIKIDRELTTPVYMQIFEQVRRQILSGELLPGYRLPPERKLADSLGVNRTTVLNAYRELKAEGLVDSHVGHGTMVLSYPGEEKEFTAGSIREPVWNQLFSQYSDTFGSSVVKELLAMASRRDIISFATGMASPEIGPLEVLAGIEEELIGKRNYRALQYSPTEGFTSFREVVAKLMQKKGVYCTWEEIMLLSGSQQGIDLAARLILDPGDIVVVEEPSFFPAIQAFKSVGARVMGVPLDGKGMRVDLLEQLLQRYRPKLIYTIPNYHNPTGVELDLERRKKLMELAARYNTLILEDDAYGDLCYDGNPMPLLKSMDNDGYVIYLSTFSKNVYSGLRLGWIAAHKRVVQKFAAARQIMDMHTNSLSQWLIERFITGGSFEAHMTRVCREYRLRRDAMLAALARWAPAGLEWSRPQGGYYIWCRLPEGISAAKLVVRAAEYRVVFVPGTPFFNTNAGDDHLRLNFTYASVKEIEEGIRRLCKAMKDLLAQQETGEEEPFLEITPIV